MDKDNLIIIISATIGSGMWFACLLVWCKLKKNNIKASDIANIDYSYDKDTEIHMGNYYENNKNKNKVIAV